MNPKLKAAAWLVVGAFTGALATIQIQAIARNAQAPLPWAQIQEFANAYGIIKAGYVEPTDNSKLIHDAISGMVSGLDPHSQYLGEEDFKEFMDGALGKFVGVGIEIIQEDGLIKIVTPIEDSPAYRAGLQSGDLITRVDNTEVRELTLQQAVQRMRGEPNTQVQLTIFRKSENRTFTVNIIREEIHTRSVKSRMIEPGYAWVRVNQFQENTVDNFVDHINDLYKQDPNLKGLVLDLRNDPGGLLTAAIGISSAFLPTDSLIVSTRGQHAESERKYLANPLYYSRMETSKSTREAAFSRDPLKRLPDAIKTVPLIVLVNEGSASASEIVAGALKDHKRAIVMGARTFGKGSVQTTVMLSENSGIKLTIALYYTPSDKSIQATGIVPDILLAEYADGTSPLSALYTREADLQHHIVVNQEDPSESDKLRAQRDQVIEQLQNTKDTDKLPRIPEYGSDEDFRLRQALNQLQGKPVAQLENKKTTEATEATDTSQDNQNK